jgi:chemotaxis protein histidine kinase CheA
MAFEENKDFNKDFEQLKEEYRASFAEKKAEMLQLLEQLELAPDDALLFAELQRRIHSLKGSGKSYGFERVTAWAVETLKFFGGENKNKTLDKEDLESLRQRIGQLDSLF